jgi:single-strand DNA-binding protein
MWEEKPNYFRVTVFGRQAESCAQYLSKGRPVAIDGRLEWSQWERDGVTRESIDIIADSVQFLGGRDEGVGNGNGFSSSVRANESDIPIHTGDFETASVGSGAAADDDIPF